MFFPSFFDVFPVFLLQQQLLHSKHRVTCFCAALPYPDLGSFVQFKDRLTAAKAAIDRNGAVTGNAEFYCLAEIEIVELDADGIVDLDVGEEHLAIGEYITGL